MNNLLVARWRVETKQPYSYNIYRRSFDEIDKIHITKFHRQ